MVYNRNDLKDCSRIIIKLGSAIVINQEMQTVALKRLASVVEQIADLNAQSRQCVLVTSGAIALGKAQLAEINSRGAKAAMGMTEITGLYDQLFNFFGLKTATMLLTPVDFDSSKRRDYWRQGLLDLLEQGIIPIINTNDSVAWAIEKAAQHKHAQALHPITDNDSLAANLAYELQSDLLILCSDVDGVYTGPPGGNKSKLISEYLVNLDTTRIETPKITFSEVSDVGTGGMQSKVKAAEWLISKGTNVVICNGSNDNVISDILDGKQVGTFFTRPIPGMEKVTTKPVKRTPLVVEAQRELEKSTPEQRAGALRELCALLESERNAIKHANEIDVELSTSRGEKSSLVDRLRLTDSKIDTLKKGLNSLADEITDSNTSYRIGKVLEQKELAEGLTLEKVQTPIGVILVIFESRPDCLPQIAGLALASGNALLFKAGSEASQTVRLLNRLIRKALTSQSLPADAIQMLDNRGKVTQILGCTLNDRPAVNLIIPRGGAQLIRHTQELASSNGGIPVLSHGSGVCHVYVDADAEIDMALNIIEDSKCNYPAACNAMETLLIHESLVPNGSAETLCKSLIQKGVILKAGPKFASNSVNKSLQLEDSADFSEEYNSLTCNVELVTSLRDAIQHINANGSSHTDSIVTNNERSAQTFLREVDSACVFYNASTRFADGYRFGLGAEVGISTSKLHARGPVGLEGLFSYKWILRGSGQSLSDFSSGKYKFKHEE
ncbi:hypothetical protein Ciccas_001080 [Cichlidogyrus casuarinus]|uniref:Delta-1-pyrroline-5-carboxylate synthase n=1 Tax=Cichlidogyrus casuarinus TaxID=1844966 RepID=A0ABD2QLD4_9PLAT